MGWDLQSRFSIQQFHSFRRAVITKNKIIAKRHIHIYITPQPQPLTIDHWSLIINLSTQYFNPPNPHQPRLPPSFPIPDCGYLIHFSILLTRTFGGFYPAHVKKIGYDVSPPHGGVVTVVTKGGMRTANMILFDASAEFPASGQQYNNSPTRT